jgi:hypothetical protein
MSQNTTFVDALARVLIFFAPLVAIFGNIRSDNIWGIFLSLAQLPIANAIGGAESARILLYTLQIEHLFEAFLIQKNSLYLVFLIPMVLKKQEQAKKQNLEYYLLFLTTALGLYLWTLAKTSKIPFVIIYSIPPILSWDVVRMVLSDDLVEYLLLLTAQSFPLGSVVVLIEYALGYFKKTSRSTQPTIPNPIPQEDVELLLNLFTASEEHK